MDSIRVYVKADLYVLRRREGGELLSLHSGSNAVCRCGQLEFNVALELIDRESLRPGESGLAALSVLHHEILETPVRAGQAIELSVHGGSAAVGRIVSVDDGDVQEDIETGEVDETEVDDDLPRIVSLLGTLFGGICILLFARNAGFVWQMLIAFASSVAAGAGWAIYSEAKITWFDRNHGEHTD